MNDVREGLLLDGFRVLTERHKEAALAFVGRFAEIDSMERPKRKAPQARASSGGMLRLVVDNGGQS